MAETLRLLVDSTRTPIGELVIACDERGKLRALDWKTYEARMHRLLRLHYGANGWTLERVRDPFGLTYGARRRTSHGDLDAIAELAGAHRRDAVPATKVWAALRRIPAGTTTSYGELARRIGRPAAVRAVGLANGANPIGIVVPCHRVIGADGSLTGYGGGLERKRWLLRHERTGEKVG